MTLDNARPPNPLLQRVGHYADAALPIVVAVTAIGNAVVPVDSPWNDFMWAVAAVSLLCAVTFEGRHREWACDLCARVLTVPAEKVERNRWWLKSSHFWWAHRRVGVAILAGSMVISFTLGDLLDTPVVAQASWHAATFSLPLAYYLWAQYRHRRLRPWCPYCGHWRRDNDSTPVPDPAESL